MKSFKTPTPEVIERALARLGKPGASAYFFDKLENPAWVTPLYQRGFFKRPPLADRSRNDGSVAFPDWPELRYLKRMAPLAPDAVGPIVADIPNTDNLRVRQLQIEIGCELGREVSQKLADRAVEWLDDALTIWHFAEPFPNFIKHLLRLRESKRALRLARRLFNSSEGDGSRRPVQLDEWHYQRYLNVCLPALREYAGLATLELLRDLLLDSTREPHEGRTDDYSYIWRCDLLHANYTHKELSDILIDAVRDTALELSRRADVGFEAVRVALLASPRGILTRIVLFVAHEVCEPTDPFVLATLTDTKLVDRYTYRTEYTQLLQAAFPRLSKLAQQQILDALTRDPIEAIPEAARQELRPDELALRGCAILRDRLSAFGAVLPSELVALRDQLVAELGRPPIPAAPTAVWHGPTSPLSLDELRAMSTAEVVAYLSSFAPAREWNAPSREGLARQLQQLVKERAQDWAREARLLLGLNPTYVRSFISGLNDACTAKSHIEWTAVLELVSWVMAQPRELAPERSGLEDEDPDWSWTRQALARLLATALANPETGLPWDQRAEIGRVILELLNDPDPPDSDPGEDGDPVTTALNCVRGVAGEALFRFAWWVHNHSPDPLAGAERSFDRMLEVRAGVDRMLADRSTAVRSVLGDWFRTLFYFDRGWTGQHIDDLFPEAPERRPYLLAAWRAFLEYDHPYDPAFGLLKPKYEGAVARLEGASEEERKRMGETGLGLHLASYYWRGVGGAETRALLLQYFEVCTPAAAAHVLWSLAQGLQGEEPLPATTLPALVDLWAEFDRRSPNWSGLRRGEVYRQFGQWFVSRRFDNRWALEQLKRAIEMGAGMLDVESILERLAQLCGEYPLEVAEVLVPLLVDKRQLWQPSLWKDQVESVLRALLNSSNDAARARAEALVDQLVENGNLFARDLLAGRGASQP